MKSESVIGQTSRDTCDEIVTGLADFGVVKRAEVTEIFELHMVQTKEKIKAEFVEKVVKKTKKALQSRYS